MTAFTEFDWQRRVSRERARLASSRVAPREQGIHGGSGGRAGGRPPAIAALFGVIDRLEEVVDRETALLSEHRSFDLHEFNVRKSQGLLELSRAIRALGDIEPGEEVARRIIGFRDKLEKNRRLLQTHLRAMQEILAIVSEAIETGLSDGTYSAKVGAKERPR